MVRTTVDRELRALLAQARRLAALVEAALPDETKSLKWQAAKHSPAPWEHTYYKRLPVADYAELAPLLVRYKLETVAELLNACLHELSQGDPPAHAPTLARTRRSS